jgi:hypothetical protein
MKVAFAFSAAIIGALALAACGSDVKSNKGAGGGATLDAECYDSCVAKGEAPALCTAFCSEGKGGDDGKGKTSSGTSSASGGSGSVGGGGTAGGPVDVELEKSCIGCWYDEAQATGVCGAEAKACEDSLACTQLQWCPLLCEKDDCIEECNVIIPTGVAPLTALVQCMACDGGPCAGACQGSVMLSYCD